YTKENEDISLNSLVIGLSDNIASLVAGMAIIPTVFVFLSQAEAMQVLASGNEGLSFVWLPVLLTRLPLGNILAILFFLGLFLAAVASLISLVELPVRVVMDWGVPRGKATWLVGSVMFIMGIPSALSVDFFKNQDWVWGLGLLLSGVFFVIASLKYGIKRMSEDITRVSDFPIPPWFLWVFLVGAVPVSFVVLMAWWFWQSLSWGEPWWNPFGRFTIATAVLQWVVVALILWLINRSIKK
ncbi:MAG: sodium-dependent transporter, partial [candidate division WOR-3 bacterium]